MSNTASTTSRGWRVPWEPSPWLMAPWWPADTLASKQRSLLRILSVAAAERLEVAPLVACLAMEQRGRYRRRLRRLAQRLAARTSLADALELTPGVLSDEQILAIRFGDQSGTLSATLANLLKAEHQAAMQVSIRLQQTVFYVGITITILILMLSFLMIKIVPSFQAIFDDFQLGLPNMTIVLIGISNFAVNYWFLIALPLLAVVWVFRSETSRRFFRRVLSSRVVRPIAALRSADLLDLLSVTLRSGRPLTGALSTLARHHFDSFIRHKLLFVRNEVEQGADVWHSMATARLITPAEAQALKCSTSVESRAWTMVRLAGLKRSRVAGQIDVGVNLLQPLITLMLAGTVLFIALACLSPLWQLINSLS